MELYTPGLNDVTMEALVELRQKSKSKLYLRDPEAWYYDVLDGAWWSKQLEVIYDLTNTDEKQAHVVVKSCNGIGKSRLVSDVATWALATHDPRELSIIITAPIFQQIKNGIFRYISDNYGIAKERGFFIPGRQTAEPAIKIPNPVTGVDKDVVQARRPADSNLISSFQGTHDGYVYVMMDEGGGLPADLFTGAEAVTTNEHAKIGVIGNPDQLHTHFHRLFTERERFSEWKVHTISAYDSPNFTGEVIHPDPEKDRQIKSHLVQVEWAKRMEKQAHPNVVRAKVYGEFPDDDDSAFFTQETINRAMDNEIEPTGEYKYLGVDLAFQGADSTQVYLNDSGHIRKVASWNYQDDVMQAARDLHALALKYAVDEMRVDASGQGRGVYSLLTTQEEFAYAPYTLIGITGGSASPDNTRWANARAWHYDLFRQGMAERLVDLDVEDTKLREQLTSQPFALNKKGAIQIMPKPEMKSKGLKSPDELDAAVYSAIDFNWLTDEGAARPGDKVVIDPTNFEDSWDWSFLEEWGDAF